MARVVIGTAGHVDHGKTALVRALTGLDTDRLKVEEERGITTELGFAPLRLSDGEVASLIDVPGHERFVRAMAAGAGGVDLVVLVVAADEGVRPQTREHLDICRLLGVRGGVLAVSKADLAPALGAGRIAMLEAELRALVAQTPLEGAALIHVSARSGHGIEDLRLALTRLVAITAPRNAGGPLYLAIDRAFSMKGFGTVATGTLLSGTLACDDVVVVLPGLVRPLRIRGLQCHGRRVDHALAGERVAINLPDVEVAALSRGCVLSRAGEVVEAEWLEVALRQVTFQPGTAPPLRARQTFLCHVGTASAECNVTILGAQGPGQVFAQLRLHRPLPVLPGQHLLLRGFEALPGRGRTLAGGVVLAAPARKRRHATPHPLADFAFTDPSRRVQALLSEAPEGLGRDALFARAALPRPVLTALLAELLASGAIAERAGRLMSPRTFARLQPASSPASITAPGCSPAESALLAVLQGGTLAPPTTPELGTRLGLTPEDLTCALARLLARGEVVRVKPDLYFDTASIASLRRRLEEHLRAQGAITVPEFKALTGSSRKYTIPLSEFFDQQKLTLRVGERRVLREARR